MNNNFFKNICCKKRLLVSVVYKGTTLSHAIRRINLYPVDNAIDFPKIYPLYPVDSSILRLNNWCLALFVQNKRWYRYPLEKSLSSGSERNWFP